MADKKGMKGKGLIAGLIALALLGGGGYGLGLFGSGNGNGVGNGNGESSNQTTIAQGNPSSNSNLKEVPISVTKDKIKVLDKEMTLEEFKTYITDNKEKVSYIVEDNGAIKETFEEVVKAIGAKNLDYKIKSH